MFIYSNMCNSTNDNFKFEENQRHFLLPKTSLRLANVNKCISLNQRKGFFFQRPESYLFGRVSYIASFTESGAIPGPIYRNPSMFTTTVVTTHQIGCLKSEFLFITFVTRIFIGYDIEKCMALKS